MCVSYLQDCHLPAEPEHVLEQFGDFAAGERSRVQDHAFDTTLPQRGSFTRFHNHEMADFAIPLQRRRDLDVSVTIGVAFHHRHDGSIAYSSPDFTDVGRKGIHIELDPWIDLLVHVEIFRGRSLARPTGELAREKHCHRSACNSQKLSAFGIAHDPLLPKLDIRCRSTRCRRRPCEAQRTRRPLCWSAR